MTPDYAGWRSAEHDAHDPHKWATVDVRTDGLARMTRT